MRVALHFGAGAQRMTEQAPLPISLPHVWRRRRSPPYAELSDGYEYRVGDAREVLADIADDSVALVLTDPPYAKAADPLFAWLADFAARILIPGGSLLFFTGHLRVADNVMACRAAGLKQWWQCAVLLNHGNRRLLGAFVICEHRPVLWFVKPPRRRDQTMMSDVLRPLSGGNKDEHPWGQGDAGVSWLIEHTTHPGELIVDPFAGTGTWGRIAAQMRRRWIGCDIVEGGSATIKTGPPERPNSSVR